MHMATMTITTSENVNDDIDKIKISFNRNDYKDITATVIIDTLCFVRSQTILIWYSTI